MPPEIASAIRQLLARHPHAWFTTLDLYRDIKGLPISEAKLRRDMAALSTAGQVTRQREISLHYDRPRNRWRYHIQAAVRIEDDLQPVEAPPREAPPFLRKSTMLKTGNAMVSMDLPTGSSSRSPREFVEKLRNHLGSFNPSILREKNGPRGASRSPTLDSPSRILLGHGRRHED